VSNSIIAYIMPIILLAIFTKIWPKNVDNEGNIKKHACRFHDYACKIASLFLPKTRKILFPLAVLNLKAQEANLPQ
jgi:hypothetical protein